MSFEEVFFKYYPRLCDFANHFVDDFYKAEDIVQDSFIKFYEQKDRISEHPEQIKSFLYSAVKNNCLNHLRHEKVVERYQNHNDLKYFEEKFNLDSIIHAEIIGEIYNTLKSLPPGCAKVFKMAYFEDLSHAEIAEKLAISVNTVKSQKLRALTLLKQKIDPEFLALILPNFLSSLFYLPHNQIFKDFF